jgi:hypothetical protein
MNRIRSNKASFWIEQNRMEAATQREPAPNHKSFSTLLQSLASPSHVSRFTLPSFEVILHTERGNQTILLDSLAPFHTVEDIQRALWIATKKQQELEQINLLNKKEQEYQTQLLYRTQQYRMCVSCAN